MSSQPENLRIRYWGVTGALNAVPTVATQARQAAMALRMLSREQLDALLAAPHATAAGQMLEQFAGAAFVAPLGYSTCIEIATPDEIIIVDAGGGLLPLATDLEQRRALGQLPPTIHLCFSHVHLDHLFGLPLCRLFYDPSLTVIVHAAPTAIDALRALMGGSGPLHGLVIPTTLSQLAAIKEFRPVTTGTDFAIGSVTASTVELNHPGGSLGWKFRRRGATFLVMTDHEKTYDNDRRWQTWAANADLLYADAQYRQAEYYGTIGIGDGEKLNRQGWGHSAGESVVLFAIDSQIVAVDLGHHDAGRNASDFERYEAEMRQYLADLPHHPQLRLARAGMITDLPARE